MDGTCQVWRHLRDKGLRNVQFHSHPEDHYLVVPVFLPMMPPSLLGLPQLLQ